MQKRQIFAAHLYQNYGSKFEYLSHNFVYSWA